MEYIIIPITIAAVVLAIYLLHRLGLWMEDQGWIYYRKKSNSGTSGVGNALHELHSFLEHDITKADQEVVVRQHRQSKSSGKPFDVDEDDLEWPEKE